jgi:hypothetical protein
MCYRIVSGEWQKHADPPHPVGLLRARRKRPCRSAEQRHETGAGRGRDAICLAPPGCCHASIPQGYRHHQETAFQFPCPVELHSARLPGPLSN